MPSWQTIRDLLIAALVAAALAGIDYLTLAIQTHPLGSAALSAFLISLLAIARRMLNPTVPVSQVSDWSFDDRVTLNGHVDAPPVLASLPRTTLDFDTPDYNVSVGADAFLMDVANQITMEIPPGPNGKVKAFDPAIIIAIVTWLLTHKEEILSAIEALKSWWRRLFARKTVRAAIVEAAMATKNLEAVRDGTLVDGMESWFRHANAATVRRVRMAALGKSE